ncbi:protein MALE DISCOVERER 2-like isoform X2 [Miscanthus floridulus]|uniref:protein MALE DISCOVERER 2-like isoform X2 n=1 Tax=Miscanthus floridulus TaxID=154761 RepID=UPI003457B29F
MVEMRSIRAAAYFLLLSLLVSQRQLGSCASINEQGRPLLRFGESVADDPIRSSLNRGVSCADDGKVVALLPKGYKLSGELPSDLHKHTEISEGLSYEALQSCRKTLTKGVVQRRLQSPEAKAHHVDPSSPSKSLPRWAIYIIAIGGALVVVAVAAVIAYLLFSRRKKDTTVMPWSTGLSGPLSKAFVAGVPSLGRAELQAACEDFINVIGSSPDCTLYKGTLSSGVEIAVVSTSVNSAEDWTDRSEEQFKNKISVLSRVNHKNLMNLLGYCTCDEPLTRMMVFEYAPCGSLFEHLHIREAEDLDWPARLRIIMGVAYCLEHMIQLDPPVTPPTLSSSSIYLTEDYAAKIYDAEFWKEDGKDAQMISDKQQDDIVYRFGILLLEVISGRLPFSEDHGLLVLWASSYLDGKRPLCGMVDPTVRSAVPDKDLEALRDVVGLCVRSDDREKRPAMGEVARALRGVTGLSPEQATPRDNPLWWAELEIASAVESESE